MISIGVVLDYDLRKSVHIFSMDKKYGKDELLVKFTQVANEYLKTEKGAKYIDEKKGVMTLHDFMEIKDDIPKDIYRKYSIFPDYNVSGHVIELKAFERLVDGAPIKAIFGAYDQDYELNNHDMMRLLNSIDWMSQSYVFRPLMYDNRLVGFGFISTDIIDDEELDFNDFMDHAATLVYKEPIMDNSMHEYEGIGIKILRLDL